MGQIIQNRQIKKTVVTLDQGSVGNLNFAPQTIIPDFPPSNDYTIIAATLSVNDPLTQITNFGHFYLEYGPSNKVAIYDEISSQVQAGLRLNFILNMSHPPNIFGSYQPYSQPLTISCQNPPITGLGNGELVVTVYYFNNIDI